MATTGRCVIVGGADINTYGRIKKQLKQTDFFIFCDCGLRHADRLAVAPSLIVGDFDSYTKPQTEVETIVLPCEKDDTDTVFAVKEGIKRGYTDFLLIGVVGARLDHTLGNLYILQMLDKLGCSAKILDDFSEMELVANRTAYIDCAYSFFSLLNITGKAEGVSIKNAKYPLICATITNDYQYGVSNEVIRGKTAEVTVENGKLLLIKVY